MATRIRLQRHGKKQHAFYHLVTADSKSRRDGRFIEKIGTYNPNTNPATIEIDFERALHWVKTGAEPSDTAKAILSYTGVLLKNHLDKGVAKGALTADAAQAKFDAWKADKDSKITGKSDSLSKAAEASKAAKLLAEKAANEAKAAELLAKNTPAVEEVVEDVVAEVVEEVAEEASEETTAEATEETPEAEA
jgi:small subunit ribosomal protein S16